MVVLLLEAVQERLLVAARVVFSNHFHARPALRAAFTARGEMRVFSAALFDRIRGCPQAAAPLAPLARNELAYSHRAVTLWHRSLRLLFFCIMTFVENPGRPRPGRLRWGSHRLNRKLSRVTGTLRKRSQRGVSSSGYQSVADAVGLERNLATVGPRRRRMRPNPSRGV
eukprot:6582706-Pyramimonas_sp.AAC.1